jgi:hypothetical protein
VQTINGLLEAGRENAPDGGRRQQFSERDSKKAGARPAFCRSSEYADVVDIST